MDIYEAKANYERLNKGRTSIDDFSYNKNVYKKYFEDEIKRQYDLNKEFKNKDKNMIDNALDFFIDLTVIRDATEEEIELYEEYKKARHIYHKFKYR